MSLTTAPRALEQSSAESPKDPAASGGNPGFRAGDCARRVLNPGPSRNLASGPAPLTTAPRAPTQSFPQDATGPEARLRQPLRAERPGPYGPQSSSTPGPLKAPVAPSGASPDPLPGPSGPLAVELCCGSANLSFHLSQVGFQVYPVDWRGNRFTPKVGFHEIDLTVPSGQSRLWEILASPSLSYVHMSPPCGTASRAREKPLPAYLRERGIPEPKPLRSEAFPLGLPTLTKDFPHEVARVPKANAIYKLCAEVAEYCSRRSVPWTI